MKINRRYKSLGWMGGLRVFIRALTFVRLGVLARLLSPFEFGLFAIGTMALSLVETLTETGINVFFIQKEGDIRDYVDSAFAVSLLRGLLIGIALFVIARPLAWFFGSPQSIHLVYWIGVVAVIRGFINPAIVQYQENLEFKKEFLLRGSAAIVDVSTSIIVSILTHSAIGLVAGMAASAMLEVVFSQLLMSPKPKLNFNAHQISHIIKRGKWVTLAGVFQYLYSNLDNLVVGKLLGVGSLGLYQNAYKIASVPITEISDVFGKVSFPHYAKVADDKKLLAEEFRRFTSILILGSGVFAAVIFLFTKPIVLVLLGPKWLEIIPALKLLSIFGFIRSVQGALPPLFLAKKRQELVTYLTLVTFVGLAVLIVPFVYWWGLIGAGYAVIFGSLLATPYLFYAFKKIK